MEKVHVSSNLEEIRHDLSDQINEIDEALHKSNETNFNNLAHVYDHIIKLYTSIDSLEDQMRKRSISQNICIVLLSICVIVLGLSQMGVV